MNYKTKIIALCGLLTAASVIVISIGSILETLDLSTAVMAGFAVIAANLMAGKTAALGVYAVTSVITLLLLPNKLSFLFYAMFGGLYPLVREYAEKIKPFWLSFSIKLAAVNLAAFLGYMAVKRIFHIQDEIFEIFKPAYYILISVTFVVYDFAMKQIIARIDYFIKKVRLK